MNLMKFKRSFLTAFIVAVAIVAVSYTDVLACSRILWGAEGQPVLVGRNMDWTERMGTVLYAMPKGIERQGLTKANPMKWTSKYGSVVALIWEAASADGMNEAGLNANLLYLAESDYGDRDPDLAGVSISVWAQYYLDNFDTVAEAVEATKLIQVRTFELTHHGKQVDAPLHVSLADTTGDSAVIEILDGKLKLSCHVDELPDSRAEVAVVGRSNVGKSSLINALTKRQGLLKSLDTSSK